ncbi:MAG TPA: guanylate kinase [Candidatus Krumholzibacteria bacterium]|nr:guanylate kinase [Candidatus Krumholzibacteria bacterium]
MDLGTSFLLLVTGPSGAGKTSLYRGLLAEDTRLGFSVSCTTRPPRHGEVDGRDYHFVARDEFERRREAGEFVEWAEVHGRLYGTLISELEAVAREGRIPVLDIDVQGGVEVIERFGDLSVCSVFVFPPDLEVLEQRLRGRGTDDEATVSRRLANAREEIPRAEHYRYWVVNDDLERARDDLRAILRAERLRRERHARRPVD